MGRISMPIEMKIFKDCKIEQIKCGATHNYVRCDGDVHYLWGSNARNECLVLDEDQNIVTPHDINEIVLQATNGKRIKDVFLGYDNTKIIVFDH